MFFPLMVYPCRNIKNSTGKKYQHIRKSINNYLLNHLLYTLHYSVILTLVNWSWPLNGLGQRWRPLTLFFGFFCCYFGQLTVGKLFFAGVTDKYVAQDCSSHTTCSDCLEESSLSCGWCNATEGEVFNGKFSRLFFKRGPLTLLCSFWALKLPNRL